jgi:hypothetical protein
LTLVQDGPTAKIALCGSCHTGLSIPVPAWVAAVALGKIKRQP